MGAGATIAAEELSPGSRVGGRYRVEAILGKGGMGTVYRAHDEQQRREVALKVLHQRVFAEQQALRTKHEFRAMVQLRHPRMVEVQDYGVLSAGTPFFVMQPAMGAGFAASRTPAPYRNRLRSAVNHLLFGLGLYAAATLVAGLAHR